MAKLSRQALENKRAYNRDYVKQYRENNDIITFSTHIPREKANEIKEYINKKGMNKKEFILWAYEQLKQQD